MSNHCLLKLNYHKEETLSFLLMRYFSLNSRYECEFYVESR